MADDHTNTDLGEGSVPVGWQLGLVMVKSCFSSWKVKVDLVAPEIGIIMEGCLLRIKIKSAT